MRKLLSPFFATRSMSRIVSSGKVMLMRRYTVTGPPDRRMDDTHRRCVCQCDGGRRATSYAASAFQRPFSTRSFNTLGGRLRPGHVDDWGTVRRQSGLAQASRASLAPGLLMKLADDDLA